ncbi:MAG: hypothetical protein IJK86_03690 [Lachnospiraceae bacterium]|nr:hypothetical protein [Lachnospiraceae bacterium]
MFGYITIARPELKIRDEESYRAFYCGLCRALKKRHGVTGQSTLSYDMTFVVLLLSALYEPPTEADSVWCPVHPKGRHAIVRNRFLDYGADMNLLLAYYNLRDDWADDKKLSARALSGLMKKHAEQVVRDYPRQGKAVRDYLAAVAEIERKGGTDPDAPANATGVMLGELLVTEEDVWAPTLRQMGFYLGKFIYLMDAYEDLEDDLKSGNYNPLSGWGATRAAVADRVQEALTQVLSEATLAFERLPIVEGEDLLRNILYAGVWTKFDEISRKDKENAAARAEEGGDGHDV